MIRDIRSGGSVLRGIKKDKEQKQMIVNRQNKRKTIEEAEDFASVLTSICPAYFSGSWLTSQNNAYKVY